MKHHLHGLGMLAWVWIVVGSVSADPQDIEKQETMAVRLNVRLDSLMSIHARFMDQAELLAGQIEANQRKALLSSGEHRLLEKQLRESQRLDSEVRDVETKKETVQKEYKQTLEKLIPLYQTEIENAVRLLEKETDPDKKQSLFARYQDVLKRKRNRESEILSMESVPVAKPDISAKPSDTARELRMKGDLRTDQAEAIQKEIQSIESRVASLKKEERVRKKADELSMNMHMFNEGEELLGREMTRDDSRFLQEKKIVTLDYSKAERGVQTIPTPEGYGLESKPTGDDAGIPEAPYQTLSDLQATLEQLGILKNKLQAKARVYREEARRFYQAAEERER